MSIFIEALMSIFQTETEFSTSRVTFREQTPGQIGKNLVTLNMAFAESSYKLGCDYVDKTEGSKLLVTDECFCRKTLFNVIFAINAAE